MLHVLFSLLEFTYLFLFGYEQLSVKCCDTCRPAHTVDVSELSPFTASVICEIRSSSMSHSSLLAQ